MGEGLWYPWLERICDETIYFNGGCIDGLYSTSGMYRAITSISENLFLCLCALFPGLSSGRVEVKKRFVQKCLITSPLTFLYCGLCAGDYHLSRVASPVSRKPCASPGICLTPPVFLCKVLTVVLWIMIFGIILCFAET